MENSKFNQIEDLRQSPEWEKFLAWLGWKGERTNKGTLISFSKSPIGKLGKTQRPQSLNLKELKEIDELCKKTKCTVLKLEPSLSQDLSVLEKAGYLKSFRPLLPPATIIIDLNKPEEELWAEVSKSGQKYIKAGKKSRTKIETYKNPSEQILSRFLALSKQTKKDRKYTGPSLKDLQAKREIFGEKMFVLFAVDPSGKDMAANVFFSHGNNAWYLHGGTATEARKTSAGYVLMWESILYLKGQGFEFLDFDGADDDRFPAFTKDWGGFSYFKEKFSKEKILFPAPYVKIYNPLLKIMTKLRGKNTL